MVSIMDEIISYKMCAVRVRNAKLRNYLKINDTGGFLSDQTIFGWETEPILSSYVVVPAI